MLLFPASSEPIIDPAEAKRPLPAPETKSVLGQAERYTLGNGMRIVLLPYRAMPIVTAQLMFDVGAAHEPVKRAGLADISASFLSPPRDSTFWRVGVGQANAARCVVWCVVHIVAAERFLEPVGGDHARDDDIVAGVVVQVLVVQHNALVLERRECSDGRRSGFITSRDGHGA